MGLLDGAPGRSVWTGMPGPCGKIRATGRYLQLGRLDGASRWGSGPGSSTCVPGQCGQTKAAGTSGWDVLKEASQWGSWTVMLGQRGPTREAGRGVRVKRLERAS
jgi:hypothetical protein